MTFVAFFFEKCKKYLGLRDSGLRGQFVFYFLGWGRGLVYPRFNPTRATQISIHRLFIQISQQKRNVGK